VTTTAREQLVQRLGVVEETTVGDPVLDALELRVQRLAPEVLGNDEAAVFELAEVESAIAQHKKRQALDALASVEMASRVRIAAEQEAAAQRVEWQSELQAIEQITDAALLKFERQITGALEAAADALEGARRVLQPVLPARTEAAQPLESDRESSTATDLRSARAVRDSARPRCRGTKETSR